MTVPHSLTQLAGHWAGKNTLYVPWLDPPQSKSDASATIAQVVNGLFMTIAYTWADHGEPHEGLLVIGEHPKTGTVSVAWTDSWHQSGSILHSSGTVEADGSVSFLGMYPAPPDPDWGWRTVITPRGTDAFDVVMTNIAPNGEETVAVETSYERVS
ncbi:MAG: DUF1579 family protein [Gemmatimonadaceae bacterium]